MVNNDIIFPGSLLERYTNIEFIESGANGAVFKAHDSTLRIDVAVKVIPKSASHAQIVRFQQEAKATSKLNHVNIVKIFNFDANSDGDVYMVIEHIPGQTLKKFISDKNEVDIAFSINLFKQICSGMQHAHDKDILHRDLKPANILIQDSEDSTDAVKIIDFGIAKVLNQGVVITTGNIAIGTPSYMSPEQGKGGPVDNRSDIYSFGCIMFEFLKGQKPYLGETSLDVLYKHANDPIPELEKTYNGQDVPEELCAVVEKSLAKDPDERFSSFTEIEVELDQVLELLQEREIESELEAESEETIEKTIEIEPEKPPVKFARILLLLVVSGVLVVLAIGFIVSQQNRQKSKSNLAKTFSIPEHVPIQKAMDHASTGETPSRYRDKPVKELENKLSFFRKAYKKSKDNPNKKSFLRESLLILNELVRQKPKKSVYYRERARVNLELDNLVAARKDAEKLLKIDKNKKPHLEVYVRLLSKEHKNKEAIEIYTRLIGLKPGFYRNYFKRALLYMHEKEFEKAIADCDKGISINPEHTDLWILKAKVLYKLGKFKDCIKVLNGIAKFDTEYGENTGFDIFFIKAQAHENIKEYSQAIENAKQASQYRFADSRPYQMIGDCYKKLGDMEKAKEFYKKARL